MTKKTRVPTVGRRVRTRSRPKARKPRRLKTVPNTAPALLKAAGLEAESLAGVPLFPTYQAACTIDAYDKAKNGGSDGFAGVVTELHKQIAAVSGGDLGRAEEMLIAQAHSLDAIFGFMAQRAALLARESPGACDLYLRLGLKAQSQCRATLETLAVIKNPPNVAFVRQANIAHGPQQVNNGILKDEGSRAREFETKQSKLSGAGSELLSDTRASALTGRIDPRMATVEPVNRATNARRKG